MKQPLKALVLAGGYSRRMGQDKALIDYHGKPQVQWTLDLLASVCEEVYISCRKNQNLGNGELLEEIRIYDQEEGNGPMGGMIQAHHKFPHHTWLIVACDLPSLDKETITDLIDNRDPSKLATVYLSSNDGLPEPLCAIYEPDIFKILSTKLAEGMRCPRKILINLGEKIRLVKLSNPNALDNINTPEELRELRKVKTTFES